MSDATVISFPAQPEHPERAQIASLVAAFEALPGQLQVLTALMLLERIDASYGRAAAAMMAQQYPQP